MDILLVAGDSETRTLLRGVLEGRGHTVTAVADGKTGWGSYQDRLFPLVILECQLPVMDERELCRRIRHSPQGADSLVVAIAAGTNPGDLEQVLAAGADDYLSRPIDLPLLNTRLAITELTLKGSVPFSRIGALRHRVQNTPEKGTDPFDGKTDQVKDALLSRMSHELRTPLNSIIGFAQFMAMSADDETIGAHRDDLKTILRSGWHLLRIIEDLLSLSAIEAHKVVPNIEDIDMRDCMQECFELMSPLASERGIEFSCVDDACDNMIVRADSFRLKQVVINLLANAVKYNRDGGSITVSGRRTPDRIRILISDTGQGIAEDDLPSLFQPFSRLVQRPLSIEGAGVGLSIAKQLTELMGGTIGVESVYGQGSTFWIELPAAAADAAVKPVAALHDMAAAPGHQATLLYIEDNPDHVNLAREIIARMGNLALLVAHTPSLGLDLARMRRPDLILLDICLPGMNGYQVLNLLQTNGHTRGIPVVAISTSANPAEIEKGLQAGFRRYLTKPIDVVKFRHAVEELLHDTVR
ncbi:MAG: response regulator [Gammaproteobacteria bacterium]|nr:response regulator [Gammaproteobacteria bacterium]